jgi:hypothetical protein
LGPVAEATAAEGFPVVRITTTADSTVTVAAGSPGSPVTVAGGSVAEVTAAVTVATSGFGFH